MVIYILGISAYCRRKLFDFGTFGTEHQNRVSQIHKTIKLSPGALLTIQVLELHPRPTKTIYGEEA